MGWRIEIPEWMFDSVLCEQMKLTRDPVASLDALVELSDLLTETTSVPQRPTLDDRQNHSRNGVENAEQKATPEFCATTETVSSRRGGTDVERPVIAEARDRDPASSHDDDRKRGDESNSQPSGGDTR